MAAASPSPKSKRPEDAADRSALADGASDKPGKTHKTAKKSGPAKPRVLQAPKYRSFRLERRIKNTAPSVKGAFKIFRQVLGFMATRWRLFGGIVLIFGVLQIMLVQGFGAAQSLNQVKQTADTLAESGHLGGLSAGVASFGYLLTASSASSAYQSFLVLVTSLALIWTFRQVHEGERPRIRDGFYYGVFPLVQFLLVLLVVALQTLPAVIVTSLYAMANGGGLVVNLTEHALWIALTGGAVTLSLYMLSSSLFALYIVTLPGMTPMRALRTARELVRYRRWTVMRRILFLPILLVLAAAVVVIPLIILVTPVAAWAFLFFTFLALPIIHGYMYELFKELLG